MVQTVRRNLLAYFAAYFGPKTGLLAIALKVNVSFLYIVDLLNLVTSVERDRAIQKKIFFLFHKTGLFLPAKYDYT
jgi:hypothetical protein